MSISIAYKKRSLPLIWSVYKGAKGHVKVEEQLKLLNKIRPLIPKHAQVYFLADAGFDSVKLFQWLSRYHWRFVIRQKGRSILRKEQQEPLVGFVSPNNIRLVIIGLLCIGQKVKMNLGIY